MNKEVSRVEVCWTVMAKAIEQKAKYMTADESAQEALQTPATVCPLRRPFLTVTNTLNKPFFFHRLKESTDIGTEKRKKFGQRDWGSNPGPLVMRASALAAELSRRSRHCTE